MPHNFILTFHVIVSIVKCSINYIEMHKLNN